MYGLNAAQLDRIFAGVQPGDQGSLTGIPDLHPGRSAIFTRGAFNAHLSRGERLPKFSLKNRV
jgi:hypothetical protein